MELTVLTEPVANECDCLPLTSLHHEQELTGENNLPMTPVTPELGAFLQAQLAASFPRTSPISLLLMHISQLEHVHISPKSAMLHTRQRLHAPESFLEQALANVSRSVRGSDRIVVHGGAGAVIIFPGVDREGVFSITERIYHSINLLQPETVIPPLVRETDIFVGVGSYPEPANSLKALLYQASCVVHRLTLRPAVTTQFHTRGNDPKDELGDSSIPFMQLPTRLPARLRNLIPYGLACELRCAPVGRDHNRLTVAMEYPTDAHALETLRATTCMVIYPVACELGALDRLLAHEW